MLCGALSLREGAHQEDDEIDEYFQLTRKNFQYYVAPWPWACIWVKKGKQEEFRRGVNKTKNELFKIGLSANRFGLSFILGIRTFYFNNVSRTQKRK